MYKIFKKSWFWFVILLCLSVHNKKGANKNNKMKRPLLEQINVLGAKLMRVLRKYTWTP